MRGSFALILNLFFSINAMAQSDARPPECPAFGNLKDCLASVQEKYKQNLMDELSDIDLRGLKNDPSDVLILASLERKSCHKTCLF